MISKSTIHIFVLLVFLSSCSAVLTQALPTIIADTVTPKISPTIQLTNTPSPTNTPEVETNIWDESISPDGLWSAVVSVTTFMEPEGEEIKLTIVSSDGKQNWIVDSIYFDHHVDLMYEIPVEEDIYLRVVRWAADNKSIYFSRAYPHALACSLSLLGEGGADLRQFDLTTGKTKILSDQLAIEMDLSPNEQQLIYINSIDSNVFLRDLSTGHENVFPVPDSQYDSTIQTSTSGLHWSPDGNYIVYAMLVGVCSAPIAVFSNIMLIDIEKMSQSMLISDEGGFLPVEWEIQDRIVLQDNDDNFWWLNPTTKEITPAE